MKEELPKLPDLPSGKKFFKMSEAVKYCGVRQDVLRFWESQISQLKPVRRGTQRRYRPQDIQMARKIRELRYKDGLSIEGVKDYLKREREEAKSLSPSMAPIEDKPTIDPEVLTKLQTISHRLKELKEFLRNK